jgi:hypothetical protein
VAGLIGYAAVALFFVVLNLAVGRPALYTAAGLGAFFTSLEGFGGEVTVAAGPVIAFNGIHMLLSVSVGMAAAWLVYEAEEHHEFWYILLLLFVALYLFGVLSFGVFGAELTGVLSWGSAVAGNAAWLLPVLGYLLWMHPRLLRELGRDELEARA